MGRGLIGGCARGDVSRRMMLAAMAGGAAALAVGVGWAQADDATPSASDAAGWSYTDVVGNTVSLPAPPTRIAAAINVAAALHDFGIETPTIFGWTANHFPEGDHVAWGNIDPGTVEVVSDTEGSVIVEKLLAAEPDVIVTWIWDKDVPAESQVGIPADLADAVTQIAPIVSLNQGDANDIELERVEAFAESLGVGLDAPELKTAREAYAAKKAEVEAIAAEKPDISVLFGSFGDGPIYVAGPDYIADLGQLRSLGITIASDGSPTANTYWESISTEQALYYPSDVLYIDQYGAWKTVEELQEHATIREHPAVKSGQTGPWMRDLPLNYEGLTTFLESMLVPLRTAKNVT